MLTKFTNTEKIIWQVEKIPFNNELYRKINLS